MAIYLSTSDGPVDPVGISYTLFQVRSDQSLVQVGSSHTPTHGGVGEYYVTGRAGELGQPGNWLIRWEYQYTAMSLPETKEDTFVVQDAVLAKLPDSSVRIQKYGWN